MLKNKEVENLVFKTYLEEIMQKKKFLKMNRYLQHGNTTCLLHSIAVSYYSYRLCKFFHKKVHEKVSYSSQNFQTFFYSLYFIIAFVYS